MKKKNLILTLAITLVVGLGATAYADTTDTNTGYRQGAGLGRIAGFRGFDVISNILKGKGVTDTEITDAVNTGKTLYSLAEEKGISNDQLKNSMLEERAKIIDNAVANGTLTKEQGDISKERITENIANCTTPGQMNRRMGGQNRGMGMQGAGRSYNSNLTK